MRSASGDTRRRFHDIYAGPVVEGARVHHAFRHCAKRFFPPQGMLSEDFFKAPILNTWIELNFHQNQEDVLAYAKSFVDHGMKPGVFMIDCTWQRDFGEWSFRPETFPGPKGMVDQMKAWGYRLMPWTSPMVNSSGVHYKQLLVKDLLMHGDALSKGKVPESKNAYRNSAPASR